MKPAIKYEKKYGYERKYLILIERLENRSTILPGFDTGNGIEQQGT